MKLHRLSMFTFLILAPAMINATLPPELYWNSMLPNTAMPKAIKDLLRAESMKKVILGLGHATPLTDQLHDDPNSFWFKWRHPTTSVAYQLQDDPNIFWFTWRRPTASVANQLHDDPNSFWFTWRHHTTSVANQLHDDPNSFWFTKRHHATPVANQLHDDPNSFWFTKRHHTTSEANQLHDDPNSFWFTKKHRTTSVANQLHDDPNSFWFTKRHHTTSVANQLHDDPNSLWITWKLPTTSTTDHQRSVTLVSDKLHDDLVKGLFFFENDLHPGKKLDLLFTKSPYSNALIPRKVADTIPFSLEKVPEILKMFSIDPKSNEAKIIRGAIHHCQEPPTTKGEEKYCATSLESMVDYVTSKFGKNIKAYSTEVEKETKLQTYTIAPGLKKMSDEVMACHQRHYPYVLFHCHQLGGLSRAYFVPLEGSDGTRVKAIAVCHSDTSDWNPDHQAFRTLNIKPGSAPVCHFSPEDNVIWIPQKTTI